MERKRKVQSAITIIGGILAAVIGFVACYFML